MPPTPNLVQTTVRISSDLWYRLKVDAAIARVSVRERLAQILEERLKPGAATRSASRSAKRRIGRAG